SPIGGTVAASAGCSNASARACCRCPWRRPSPAASSSLTRTWATATAPATRPGSRADPTAPRQKPVPLGVGFCHPFGTRRHQAPQREPAIGLNWDNPAALAFARAVLAEHNTGHRTDAERGRALGHLAEAEALLRRRAARF